MSTSTTVKVNASEMAAFNARYPSGPNGDTGATIAEAAKVAGYASTGAAGNAIKKVRQALLDGAEIVMTDGDGGTVAVSDGATAKVVDRLSIADAMVPGAAMVVDAIDKLTAQKKALDDAIEQRLSFARAGGFDWDAFTKAVDNAANAQGSGDGDGDGDGDGGDDQ